MRSRQLGCLAAVTGALLLVGACGSAGGVAGVGTLPPAPANVPEGAPGSVIATIPGPTPTAGPQGSVLRPAGGEPVQVPPPKLSEFTYAFPVKGCKVKYERKLLVLPKTTIWARAGCAFVSPVNGTIEEVTTTDRWTPGTDMGAHREGRFVTVIGEDGVRYLGGHLESVTPGLKPGDKVQAGKTLGKVGNSGNAQATAPNLYFAISWKTAPGLWWVRRGMVKPWDYLDAWRTGNRTLSPKEETQAVKRKAGDSPACQTLCSGRAPLPPSQEPPAEPRPQPTKKPKTPRPTPESTIPLPEVSPASR
jgi:hypothetical protein